MFFERLFDPETSTNTYLLADLDSRQAILIDPVLEHVERDLGILDELDLELVFVLDTHVHADHVTGSGLLRHQTGALSGVAATAGVAGSDLSLRHGDVLRFGGYTLEVRATPGHTTSCLTFIVEADDRCYAFTGDTLFVGGCGRTDFQEGDSVTLYRSVHEQIFSLPDETVICPGHTYGTQALGTVRQEKRLNPRLALSISEAEFVGIMSRLELRAPKALHENVAVNRAGGIRARVDSSERAGVDCAGREDSLELLQPEFVVDVRSPSELRDDSMCLPDALSMSPSELLDKAGAWPRQAPILIVCSQGNRSAEACQRLSDMGFRNVMHLCGGTAAWFEGRGA